MELLDCPGLLWPRLDDQQSAVRLAYTGAINDDTLDKGGAGPLPGERPVRNVSPAADRQIRRARGYSAA